MSNNDDNKDLIPVNNNIEKIKENKSLVSEQNYESEKEEIKTTRYSDDKEKNKKNIIGIVTAIIALVLIGMILMFGYKQIKTGGTGFDSENAQEVIHSQENPALKAEKLDPNKVYKLSGASDTFNNLTISIDKIQFRKDQTRLWVHIKNEGSQKINMMPNVNATLVDNNGNSYKVDSFTGKQITGVAPGVSEEAMLVFAPIQKDAKQIYFHLDMIFDLKNSSWAVNIPVEIP